MRLFTTFLIFLFCSSLINAEQLPGYYVTTSGDTISCTFDLKLSSCKRDEFCFSCDKEQLCPSVYPKFVIILKEGKKISLSPEEIKMFQIDTPKGSQKYISLKFKKRKHFVRIVELGKVDLYEIIMFNSANNVWKRTWVIQIENKLPESINTYYNWEKKVFLKYLEDHKYWFKSKKFKYEDIPKLVREYNLENVRN